MFLLSTTRKNGHPHVPDPDVLNTICTATRSHIARDDSDADERTHAPQNSLKQKGQPAKPYRLSYYGPMWRDCLEEAKLECRVTHLLDNPFPSKLNNLCGSITEVLATVVVECGNRGEQVEQGACIRSLLSLLMMLQVNGPKTKYIWQSW